MKKKVNLTEIKVNNLHKFLSNVWKDGSINTYPSGFFIKDTRLNSEKLLEKAKKYKSMAWKNKFIGKHFGLYANTVLTQELLIETIIKVIKMK